MAAIEEVKQAGEETIEELRIIDKAKAAARKRQRLQAELQAEQQAPGGRGRGRGRGRVRGPAPAHPDPALGPDHGLAPGPHHGFGGLATIQHAPGTPLVAELSPPVDERAKNLATSTRALAVQQYTELCNLWKDAFAQESKTAPLIEESDDAATILAKITEINRMAHAIQVRRTP